MYVHIYHSVATELKIPIQAQCTVSVQKKFQIPGMSITKSCFICSAVTIKWQTHVVSHIISQPRTKDFIHIIFLLKLTEKILHFSIFNTVLLKSEAP